MHIQRCFLRYALTTLLSAVATSTVEKTKMCRYRENLFSLEIWNWVAGEGCYRYYNPSWFAKPIRIGNMPFVVDNISYIIPFGRTEYNTNLLFDYTNQKYSILIENSFKSELYFKKWQKCAISAESCCTTSMDDDNVYPSADFPCPAVWDAWSCFPAAKNNSISELPCPDYTTSSTDTPCALYSQKECFSNGTWNHQTEYGTCASAPIYRRRHNFHVVSLYVSIALSLPAVIIFTSYRNLRILRVNLHRNLLIACITRNIFTILSKELVILDSLKSSDTNSNTLNENGVPCRVLAYFNSVAANAIYACMLIDGFYLHKLIVRIFSDDPNVYIMYGVTVVLSILPTSIWAVLVTTQSNVHCWMADNSWYQWVPDGFRIAILSINIILLLDIIRALLSKLRQNVSAQHTKSTLKAMSFLIPLFGVPFILTANRDVVDQNSCTAGDIYYYVSYSIQALQTIMVAVLFCYWNKEVHNQIKTTYRKLKLYYQARFGLKNGDCQAAKRRETTATYVNNHSVMGNNHINIEFEDPNKKVNDWLSGSDSLKIYGVTTDHNITDEHNSAQKSIFDNVSKFIDESNENLATTNESNISNN